MHAAVTAVGVDRPGIVAGVAEVLYRLGCNIEDSRMAILGGHFSMMLIVSVPGDRSIADLEGALGEQAARADLVVSVRPVSEAAHERPAGEPFVVSVYGADKPGIVWRVSAALAERRVNIDDLATHVVAGDPPVYVMVLEVTVPRDADEVARSLEAIGADLGVDVSMRPMETETL